MIDLISKRLGEFEVVRELGRGGMGIVFEAVQTSLNRRVALKVLGPGLGLTTKAVSRFRREAESAAKLHHTNIVPVYATGEEAGIHFYAMELIDGPSLDRVIAELRNSSAAKTSRLAPELTTTGPYLDTSTPPGSAVSSGLSSGSGYFDTVARLVADVAEALHHAHQNNVIHRDIKPGNLLLASDGRLSVNDFGLARALEEPGMTTTGEFVGTPAYMAPEQVAGGRIPVDHRCDIYSLGATLYELLTLRPPFVADRRDQLLAMVVQKEPPAPRRVNPKVPRDLETICLKCLEKDPDRRYQSGQALAEDLRRFVNRYAIQARRAGLLTKAKKWVRRNPALTGAGVAVLLALGAAGVFAWKGYKAEQTRLEEKRKQDEVALVEKRRTVMERGMLAALAADLPAAERAVAEAESLGASAGETSMLRGFIALYAGRSTDAVKHLEQAVQLMPESVSALALLCMAHTKVSDGQSALRALEKVSGMTPRTPEDKLFLGQALADFQPADALRLMREALAERSSVIGHVLKASVSVTRAEFSGTMDDAEAAIADTEMAKQLLANPVTLSDAAFARFAAAAASRRAGRMDKWEEHLTAAEREAAALAQFPNNEEAVYTRFDIAMFRDGLDGRADKTAELRRLRVHATGPGFAFLEALNLLCLGREAEAGKLADEFPDDRLNAHIRFLVALGRRDGRQDARRAWERVSGPDRLPYYRLEAAPLLFAVGSSEELATLARQLRTEAGRFRDIRYSVAHLAPSLAFLEGTSSETDLLESPATDQFERCRRHYLIGWKRLGAGDRDGAKAAFRKAYDVMPSTTRAWVFSRAILILMKDPEWPRAIPHVVPAPLANP